MPGDRKNERSNQIRIVSEMSRLCSPRLPSRYTVCGAAKIVSGEDKSNPNSEARQSRYAFTTYSSQQIRRIYNYWTDFGALPCDKYKTGGYRKRKQRKDNSQWSAAALVVLKTIIDNCPVLYLDEISKLIQTKLKIKFSSSSISKALRHKLRYSRKVVYEKATQQLARDKFNFIETMRFYIQKPEMAIFIDESNKDRKAAKRKYGWSPIGTQVNYKGLFNMDTRYTLIGAADFFGFVIPACETVLHKYKDKEEHKPVDADRFVQYVQKKLVPMLGNYSKQEPHSVVIMDNCSIHIDIRVRQLIEATGAIIVYSAPYSPELIPIEYMFHQWKAYLKRNYIDFNINWYKIHIQALMSVTRQQGINYFKNTTLVELVENHPESDDYKNKICKIAVVLLCLNEF
jgi:transposase